MRCRPQPRNPLRRLPSEFAVSAQSDTIGSLTVHGATPTAAVQDGAIARIRV
jgi:hypothetical protein